MGYIIRSDYYKSIQEAQLVQVTGGDNNILLAAESTAMSRAIGMLVQKYDTAKEFTPTQLYSTTTIYRAADRVYTTYPTYVNTNSYTVGMYCVYSGQAYVCISNTTGAFNASAWSNIGSSTSMYYAAYPYAYFDLYGVYAVDDMVFYKGKIYKCLQRTASLSNFVAIQYLYEDNIPPNNVFPDDPNNGSNQWKDEGAYTVAANLLASAAYNSGTTYTTGNYCQFSGNIYICTAATTTGQFNPDAWRAVWILGDNRDQLMVTSIVDIALWYVHKRIAPNNIPDLRVDAYNVAIEWLRRIRDGIEQAANVPLIQPKSGRRILSDSLVARNNYY